jgi:hypothetical protein
MTKKKVFLMAIITSLGSLAGASAGDPTIRVEFINMADKSVIARSEMPASKLPDTFAIRTTLEIKDQKWVVESAEPAAKADFLKTGTLRLTLSRAIQADPKKILFSLPTISNDVGKPEGQVPPSDSVFAIHEDDWRQVEFVSGTFAPQIHQELVDIQQIWRSQKMEFGFKTLHVRQRIPEPMTGASLSLDELKKVMPAVKVYAGVGFQRTRGIVSHSFAWAVDRTFTVWGIADERGNVIRLCVSGFPENEHVSAISEALSSLTRQHQLRFVDWCRMAENYSDAEAFKKYFGRLDTH